MELGAKARAAKTKEQRIRTTLRNVRAEGHPYVELREDGKQLIFFCALCLSRCYGASSLYDHLEGSRHTERQATALITLLKPNPWPFNDGMPFFHGTDLEEKSKSLPASECGQNKLLDIHHDGRDSQAMVKYKSNVGPASSTHSSHESEDSAECDENPSKSNLDGDGSDQILVIPAALQKDKVSDLVVRHIGVGKSATRFSEKVGVSSEIRRIWCEWLGNVNITSEDIRVTPKHDFAIITFAYNYNLGRKGFLDGFRSSHPSSPHSEADDSGSSRGRKRKSFSDPEDTSEASRNQDESSGEESQSSNNPKSKALLSGNDDQLVQSRIVSGKTMRKLSRKKLRIVSKRRCELCRQKMLPNKDVAAMLNRKTGKLVCSSRNFTGVFHIYHISCLILWILLFEIVAAKQSEESTVKPKSRKKVKGKNGQKPEMQGKQIGSPFCPECQGTAIRIDGDELEKPTVSLSELFQYEIKLLVARDAWLKSPELLDNCSIGLDFPEKSDEIHNQEYVSALKYLHFYRAVD